MICLPVRFYQALPGKAPGHVEETLEIPQASVGLVLVDVYSSIQEGENVEGMTPEMLNAWDTLMAKHLAPATIAARAAGLPVIYVMNSAPRLHLEGWELGQKLRRSFGTDFPHAFREGGVDPLEYHTGRVGRLAVHPAMEPQPGDIYIRKHAYSGFFETRLDTALKNLGLRLLVMAGLWLDACLMATMLDALFRNYRVILLRDGTMSGGDLDPRSPFLKTRQLAVWTEAIIGYSMTCNQFGIACNEATV